MTKASASAPIPRASLAPGMVPAEELPSLWQRSIAPFFDSRPVAKPVQGQALPDIHQYHLERALFIDSRFSGQIFTRDRQWMHRYDDSDHLALQLFVEGENDVANGTRNYVEQPGNIYAVNLAHTVAARSTDARVLSLVLPRDLLRDEVPHLLDAVGAVFAPHSAGARIFVDHMMSLSNALGTATAAEIPAIVKGTLGLLDALSLHDDATAVPALNAAFQAACRYIDRHLADPDLGPGRICRHLSCSRATLYRLFERQGGVRQHIQRRRLIACFKAISSEKHRHRRIFDIAFDWGFTSPSHFSHLFRQHFGIAPRDARDGGLGFAGAAPSSRDNNATDAAERMWLWAKTLAAEPPRDDAE